MMPSQTSGSLRPGYRSLTSCALAARASNRFSRSGAGVDGLQGSSNVVVFGEIDWSPGVHEQCCGRVHRDGQDDPCSAYFLISDQGSDPIMAEVLGIKRDQIEGVRNPDSALAERVDTGENNIRRLAREFLAKRGHAIEPDTKAHEQAGVENM